MLTTTEIRTQHLVWGDDTGHEATQASGGSDCGSDSRADHNIVNQ
jgi:hypothetical protein